MPWYKNQRMAAGRAATEVGFNAQQRHLILARFGNRAMYGGELTSKSPRLTQHDYEEFMAVCEAQCQGQLPGWPACKWDRALCDELARQRRTIGAMAAHLADLGALHRDEDGRVCLRRMLDQIGSAEADQVEQLDRQQAGKLISKLRMMLRQRDVDWDAHVQQEAA